MNRRNRLTLTAIALALFWTGAARAETLEPSAAPSEPATASEDVDNRFYADTFDTIWGVPTLYKDKENPYIQELSLFGRLQWQHMRAYTDRGDGTLDLWRRARVGAKLKFLEQFELKANVRFNLNGGPLDTYIGLDEATFAWKPSKEFNLALGKQKIKFGYEESTSSKKILTVERSVIANTLAPGKPTGAQAYGDVGPWSYRTGIWAGDVQKEFTQFDEGYGIFGSVGYDFTEHTDVLDALGWRLDYFYNSDLDNSQFAPYTHQLATSVNIEKGRVGLINDWLVGTGDDPGDVWGVVVMPYWDVLKNTPVGDFQLVARYEHTDGDADTVRALSRVARIAPDIVDGGRGDNLDALYLGLNWYLYEHKLKLMTGVEWFDLSDTKARNGDDVSGHAFFFAARMYF